MSFEEFPMWSVIAVLVFIALPTARCRCEGLGMDFCLDKQSYFHEDTDLDEQAGTIPDERQLPIKSKPTTKDTKDTRDKKEPELPEIHIEQGKETKRATEKEHNISIPTTKTHKQAPTDKYDDEAMMSKFIEEEDVDREDHVTQTQYLSDLAVNTDNEITSLHAEEEPQQTFNFAGADHDPFVALVNDDDLGFDGDGAWSRVVRDIPSSEEPSSEESDESTRERDF